MSENIIKYIIMNDVLYRIIECETRGYGGSSHISSSIEKVNTDEVSRILKEHENNGKEIPTKFFAYNG